MARKYFIETYGCQMNVHDSERMAGLLEQAGYEPTADDGDADVVVINTCSVRETAEEKLFTRLGEFRQMELETGHRPIVAVAGCVAQQEGDRRFCDARRPSTSSSARRTLKRLPMLVEQARRTPAPARAGRSISIRSTTCRFRSASRGATIRSRPTSPSSKAATSSAPSASCRTRAATSGCGPAADILAEARQAVGDRRARDPAARPDRQSLPGAGRSGLRLRRRCSSA